MTKTVDALHTPAMWVPMRWSSQNHNVIFFCTGRVERDPEGCLWPGGRGAPGVYPRLGGRSQVPHGGRGTHHHGIPACIPHKARAHIIVHLTQVLPMEIF